MLKKAVLLTSLAVLLLGYQNCSMNSHMEYSSATFFSLGSSCDDITKQAFVKTYYPVLRNKCVSCHVPGGSGNGFFASADVQEAASAFVSKGRARVEHNFVNAGHHPPYTGPDNQPTIDANKPIWAAADTAYNSCMTSKGGTSYVVTAAKNTPAIYNGTAAANGPYTHVEWDLNSDVAASLAGKIPATVGIDIRRAVMAGSVVGYEFRNPTVRLNSAAAVPVQLVGLRLVLNDIVLNDMTTFSLLDFTGDTTTNTIMMSGGAGLAAVTVANADTFGLRFDMVNVGGASVGGPAPAPTPAPTPTPTPVPTAVSFTQLQSTDAVLGVFRRSCNGCHNAGNMSGGFNITDYASAKGLASTINARMNNAGNPMPPSGMLGTMDRAVVNVWVTTGTPQ